MSETLRFWLTAELLGLLGVPVVAVAFSGLPGRALALARPFGLLLATYCTWIVVAGFGASYGGATRAAGVAAVAALAATIAAVGMRRRLGRASPRALIRGRAVRLWLAGELLFTLAFFGWALMRSYAPDIWQTEKPMDMAFISSIDRTASFPPADPWFAHADLNYYYYGHYITAFLGRLSGVSGVEAYNLGLALFFALALTSVFAVATELVLGSGRFRRPRTMGLVLPGVTAAVFAVILGNLAGSLRFFHDVGSLAHYDWWSPSRVIPNTANEFPFFSFLLGDLHAHVMATSFSLIVLAFALQLLRRGPRTGVLEPALAGLVAGSLYAINTISYPAALLTVGLALAVWAWRSGARARWRTAVIWAGVFAGASVVFFLPFFVSFSPQPSGIGIVTKHTPFTRFGWDTLRIYALPLLVLAPLFATRLRRPRARPAVVAVTAVTAMVLLVVLAPARVSGVLVAAAIVACAFSALFASRASPGERSIWLVVAVGGLLAFVGEAIYIRDSFDHTVFFRFNTVFKAGYEAWFLLAVASAAALWLYRPAKPAVAWVWTAGATAAALLLCLYPIGASYSRSAAFSAEPTLDGMRWLTMRFPGDSAAIRWLQQHVQGTPTVLEAAGGDFDPDGLGRVSVFTGLPAVIQWPGHELQWGHRAGSRVGDVKTIYTTRDAALARRLLDRYRVRYVVIGKLEEQAYPAADFAKFERLGRRVFTASGTRVYRIDGA